MRVLVVAKAPVAGRAKTRLVPPLNGEQAAGLAGALLLDTLDACRAEAEDVRLLVPDAADIEPLRALSPDTPIVAQAGRGLADALCLSFRVHAAETPTAIVSSDVPGLPRGSLERARTLLAEGADVVLGPSMDGGYWLIAMREAHEAPFREIPWSTPAVLAVTLERCAAAGLAVELLDPWRDIDTAADLSALGAELDAERAPRTAVELERLTHEGIVILGEVPSLVSSELVLGSPWRSVVQDRLVSSDNRTTSYAYIAAPRAAFVVPLTPGGDVVLVRQYRHPVRDWTLEVPAGSVEDGETAREAAERELLEEVGGTTTCWRHLSTFYSSSAHLSLRSDAFLAEHVALSDAHPDENERVERVRLPFEEALRIARAGGFAEGQTSLALLLAGAALGV